MRLQKFMAHCGVASRRKCEELISAGKVKVNGVKVTDMGIQINPDLDFIELDGKQIKKEKLVYILLNKPRGYVTTVQDQFKRATVLDLIGEQKVRVYPVGRLDYDTQGLLILTNDGKFAFKLTHPKYQIEKEYYVIATGKPPIEKINMLRLGINLDGIKTSRAIIVKKGITESNTIFTVCIKEGRNRQIRRMFEYIDHPVIFLRRERVGNLTLGTLKPGEWRFLTYKEIKNLYNQDC